MCKNLLPEICHFHTQRYKTLTCAEHLRYKSLRAGRHTLQNLATRPSIIIKVVRLIKWPYVRLYAKPKTLENNIVAP